MVSKVEAITEVDAAISIVTIVRFERREHSQFNTGCIAIFRHGANDFDSDS